MRFVQSHIQQHVKSAGAQKPGWFAAGWVHFDRVGSVQSASVLHVVEHRQLTIGPPAGQHWHVSEALSHVPTTCPEQAGPTSVDSVAASGVGSVTSAASVGSGTWQSGDWAWTHPCCGSQVSTVHALPSSQWMGATVHSCAATSQNRVKQRPGPGPLHEGTPAQGQSAPGGQSITHAPAWHVELTSQVPQVPPHPSSPQSFPVQSAWHGELQHSPPSSLMHELCTHEQAAPHAGQSASVTHWQHWGTPSLTQQAGKYGLVEQSSPAWAQG